MEFKFRAVDDRSSDNFPSSSSGFSAPSSDQIVRPDSKIIRSRAESVELEKLQIREEIVASEMARRIALEAEVRRELVTEWEMAAMHRVRETGLSYEQSLTMHLDPRLPILPHFHSLNRWRPEACFNLLPPPLTLLPSPVLLPPPLTQVLESEVKDASEEKKNRLIIMPKPDPNRVVGAKWKTPPPAGATELPQPSISSKVTQNEEWSRAICQINATSEEVLAGHLAGKKHKAKEARQKAHEREKNSDNEIAEDNGKIKNEKDLQLINTEEKAESSMEKKIADTLQKKHAPTVMNVVEMTPELRKKKELKFRCETCSVDVNSKVLMETHKKGRKHRARLEEKKIADSLEKKHAPTAMNEVEKKSADSPEKKHGPTVMGAVEKKSVDSPEKKHEPTVMDTVEMTPELTRKKKFKFWCEICSIGVNSEVVMKTHKNGKKHSAQLQRIGKSNVAAVAATTTDTVTEQATSKDAQMPKAADVVSDEAKLMDVPNAEKL